MSQQLNLFDPSLKPKRDWLSLSNVVVATGCVLAFLVMLGGWGRHLEDVEMARLKSQEGQLKTTQAQLVELAAMQANRKTDPGLEKELADKKAMLQQRSQVLSLLEEGGVGQPEGFAPLMEALARQVPEGLWLQSMDVHSGGKALVLRGGLLTESLLPRFVQALNQEPLFKGRRFSTLEVQPVAPLPTPADGKDERTFLERNGYLQFSLEGTKAQELPVPGGRP